MKKKKESRWRREQEHRKKSRGFKTVKWVLVLIFLILLVGIGWRLTKVFEDSVWDGQNRFNLVFHTQPITIASFDPLSQSINFLTVPDGTYIEAASDYGPYRIEKIYPLGELEEEGIELLAKSVESYFGLPIDGWLDVKEESQGDEGIKQFLSQQIGKGIGENSITNLSLWDLTRLWLMVVRTRAHRVETLDLGETSVAEEFVLPDGTKAKRVDEQRVSRIISDLFTDDRLRQEDFAIAMMNASGKAGLAAKAARLVTNIGGRLVEVGDWPEELSECRIQATAAAKNSYSAQKLALIFGCQIESRVEEGFRWDLLIILTEESWQ